MASPIRGDVEGFYRGNEGVLCCAGAECRRVGWEVVCWVGRSKIFFGGGVVFSVVFSGSLVV